MSLAEAVSAEQSGKIGYCEVTQPFLCVQVFGQAGVLFQKSKSHLNATLGEKNPGEEPVLP